MNIICIVAGEGGTASLVPPYVYNPPYTNAMTTGRELAMICETKKFFRSHTLTDCPQFDQTQKNTLSSAYWQKEQNYLQNGLICLYISATQPPRLWGLYPTRNLGGFFVPENQGLVL